MASHVRHGQFIENGGMNNQKCTLDFSGKLPNNEYHGIEH